MALIVFSDFRPGLGRLAVAGIGGEAHSKLMPLLDEIRWVMAGTVESSIRRPTQQVSEAQQQKRQKRRKKGLSRTPFGMVRARQQCSLKQPQARLAMLSCCAGHRLLAVLATRRWLPATQRDLCSKVSLIILR